MLECMGIGGDTGRRPVRNPRESGCNDALRLSPAT
jgi:hypothetical protein